MSRLQPGSITRGFQALRAAAALLAVARLLVAPASARQADGPGPGWRPAPVHLALFAPPRHRAAYQAFVSGEPLDRALAGLLARIPALRSPGSWEATRMSAADAFGSGGPYDRWQLARLYGARSPRVSRGAVLRDGRGIETWTLISPFPDAALRRLDPGTLLLVLRIP